MGKEMARQGEEENLRTETKTKTLTKAPTSRITSFVLMVSEFLQQHLHTLPL